MCEAIHTVHHGEKYLCSAISDKIRNNLNLGRDLIFDNLTSREMMVCKEIIFGSSLEDIASKAGITVKETKSLKAAIFDKLHIDNDISLMHLAIRNGLIDQHKTVFTGKHVRVNIRLRNQRLIREKICLIINTII